MDLRSLRYFKQVADSRSFSKAAAQLRVGQPALSRSVHLLELELGVQLLRRSSRGVEVTQAGQLLWRRAKEMLDRFDLLRDEVRAQADEITGSATLGVPSSVGQILVPALFRHLKRHHAGIRLDISEGISAEIYERLTSHTIHVGLLYDPLPHRDFAAAAIATEDIYLVGREDFVAGLGAVNDLDVLENVPMVLPGNPNSRRLLVEKAFRDRGLILNVVAEVDGFATTRALLLDGVGASFMTRSALVGLEGEGSLVAVELPQAAISWQLSLVTHRGQSQNRVVQVVSAAVRSVALDLIRSGCWQGSKPATADVGGRS